MNENDDNKNSKATNSQNDQNSLQSDAVIDSFRGDFAFLSNFHPSIIYVDGKKYNTVEHAYQAAKAVDLEQHELIRCARTPGEAKKMGKIVPCRSDWEDVKIDVMRSLIRKKFENPFLRPLLLATEGSQLIHKNYWHDIEFGVFVGEGKNLLGKLLMEERERIKKEHK